MTIKASAWIRLPKELKAFAQWCVAGANKAPLSIDANGKLFNASVVQPSTWLTFDQATKTAHDHSDFITTHLTKKGETITQTGLNIGFVLSENDPFTCIDIDIKTQDTHPLEPEVWTDSKLYDAYWNIVVQFNSYTELSRNGKGLHIWAKGDIGKGFRRHGVEIYSRERFIICTGEVRIDLPIEYKGVLLASMVADMAPLRQEIILEEKEAIEDDWSILNRAIAANNNEKFLKLWQGNWEGYPSQSEADLALMSMFTFYSDSNAQCLRLFHDSALGKREKAHRPDYLNNTLRSIRERQQKERSADLSAIVAQVGEVADRARMVHESITEIQRGVPANRTQFDTGLGKVPIRNVPSLHLVGQGNPVISIPPAEVTGAALSPVDPIVAAAGKTGIPWPPGFAGHIARFIYQSSPRPVKEVAIVAALGLLAGLCGKAWHIPQSGLNLYVILIARSGIGKETMHSGIGAIVNECIKHDPFFSNFVDFTEYVSGPALIKACLSNSSFVNVSGEWGRKLKQLANEEGRPGPLQALRTQMTNLYQKSGPQSIAGGLGYSTVAENVASVAGVSYSMIGESTPETFYSALTEDMMEDGFLSRFLMIEYTGDRPPSNENAIVIPDEPLKEGLCNISRQAKHLSDQSISQPIGRDEEAATLMREFELRCDKEINNTEEESRRQMWNRAALKTMRVAGLLSVADNYITPCINKGHIEWAQKLILKDIDIMQTRLDSGDVGSGDTAREKKIVKVLQNYLTKPVPSSYKVRKEMQDNNIISRSYLQNRIQSTAAFYHHRIGTNKALEDSIQNLISNGYIMEVAKPKLIEAFNFHGLAYRILNLPDYESQSKN